MPFKVYLLPRSSCRGESELFIVSSSSGYQLPVRARQSIFYVAIRILLLCLPNFQFVIYFIYIAKTPTFMYISRWR